MLMVEYAENLATWSSRHLDVLPITAAIVAAAREKTQATPRVWVRKVAWSIASIFSAVVEFVLYLSRYRCADWDRRLLFSNLLLWSWPEEARDHCTLEVSSSRDSNVVGEGEEARTSDTDVVACSLRQPSLPCATILSDRQMRTFASEHCVHEHTMLPNR